MKVSRTGRIPPHMQLGSRNMSFAEEPLELLLARTSRSDTIRKEHFEYLQKLKSGGFEPRVIYDIGSCVLNWTHVARKVWPSAEIIAFDAFEKAEFLYKRENIRYHIGVLGDSDEKIVKFYENERRPEGNSYYRENSRMYPEKVFREIKMAMLDTVVEQRNFPLPDLVKIDVQGSEKDLIEGGLGTISNAKHLIVEMQRVDFNIGAPKVEVTLPWIESNGWKCTAPLFCDNGPDGDYGFTKL
jgi:FkbM family methyltransferase